MAYLIYAPRTSEEKIYPLQEGINTIGRALDNQIVIVHESMSRRHAEIAVMGQTISVRDLDSLNHTFVNQVPIQTHTLRDGDSLRCGNVDFLFRQIASSASPPSPLAPGAQETTHLLGDGTVIRQFQPHTSGFDLHSVLQTPLTGQSVLRLSQGSEQQRAVDKLKILLEVSKQLSSPETLDITLQKVLDLLFQIMNVDRGAILLVQEKTGTLEQRAVKTKPGLDQSQRFCSRQITQFVLDQGQGIITADAQGDDRFQQSHSILAQAIHSSMCVPLKPHDRTLGVLYVDNLSLNNAYTDEDMDFLTALGNQAAIAIENVYLVNRIQAEAVMRDKLERFFPQAVSRKIKETEELGIIDTEVTALFADISDFTQMSSIMEPRQVISMLNDYFQVMVEDIVFHYEGTLEKYIGDALLAIWGAPYRQADDAERAVRAAIAMQMAVQKLSARWQQEGKRPITIHVGLNTGPVAAGNIGSQRLIQYAAIGDTTNVTSRICSAAKAGEILLSESTRARIAHLDFPLEALPPVQVKGKEHPLNLYRLPWQKWPAQSTLRFT